MRVNVFIFLAVVILSGCNEGPDKQTAISGSTEIVVDESLAPIVEEEWQVFSSIYTSAKIKFHYRPENQLLNYFLADSVRIAIMSRKLNPDEAKVFEKKNIKVRVNRFAIDAVALISNKNYADSTIALQKVMDVLKGKNTGLQLVFDNANSSTVRYLKNLAGISQLPASGVYALKSNNEVIKYVHNNSGAVGVIGVNWVKRPDQELEGMVEEIKILKVKNLPGKPGSDAFYAPSQNNLALGLYPLSRNLYIINCQGSPGLGTGFASFLASDRGQRIVLKSGLLPDSVPPREILIRK